MRLFQLVFLILGLVTVLGNQPLSADRVDTALRESQRSGKPLLALGTMKSCAPCTRLKATLRSDSLRNTVSKCVFLKMDADSPEFSHFASRFPADTSIVPMVYVILPDGTQMYANGGIMESDAIANLLNEAISYSSILKKSTDRDEYRQILAAAKLKARERKLIDALLVVSQLAEMQTDSPEVAEARKYKERLVEAVSQWLQDLDQQVMDNEEPHGATFRIAQIFVELRDFEHIHKMSGQLLVGYAQKEPTRSIVAQAKHLLKAKYRQDDNECQDAITSYQRVVEIDADSPAGKYAAQQLKKLRIRLAEKLTAIGG